MLPTCSTMSYRSTRSWGPDSMFIQGISTNHSILSTVQRKTRVGFCATLLLTYSKRRFARGSKDGLNYQMYSLSSSDALTLILLGGILRLANINHWDSLNVPLQGVAITCVWYVILTVCLLEGDGVVIQFYSFSICVLLIISTKEVLD